MSDKDARAAAVISSMEAEGGVVLRQHLVRAGHSKHLLADLVAGGVLLCIRRRWVALPDADAWALAAARAGVVVTCVTEARRQGLWTLHDGPPHVACAPHAAPPRVAEGTVVHWRAPMIPRIPGRLFDAIENVLVQVAHCQPFEAALAVWESALNKVLVDRSALERLPLTGRAREILDRALPYSDSGLETIFATRLRWLGLRIVPQAWIAGHRVDFLLGERLIVQIDGATHVGRQRDADVRHDALLALRGYHVIRVGYLQVMDDWPAVQEIIMRAVAQGLHRAR